MNQSKTLTNEEQNNYVAQDILLVDCEAMSVCMLGQIVQGLYVKKKRKVKLQRKTIKLSFCNIFRLMH